MPSLLPYDSVMWLQALPTYEWEPVPPATPLADPAADGVATGAIAGNDGEPCDDTAPAMQLVFKGWHWVAVPAWSQRENLFFDQIAQDERDQDELRNESRKPKAVHAPPPEAAAPASEPDAGDLDAPTWPSDE